MIGYTKDLNLLQHSTYLVKPKPYLFEFLQKTENASFSENARWNGSTTLTWAKYCLKVISNWNDYPYRIDSGLISDVPVGSGWAVYTSRAIFVVAVAVECVDAVVFVLVQIRFKGCPDRVVLGLPQSGPDT